MKSPDNYRNWEVVFEVRHRCNSLEMLLMSVVFWTLDLQVLNSLGRSTLMMAIRCGRDWIGVWLLESGCLNLLEL